MIPLLLALLTIAQLALPGLRVWSYWPVTLIATGLEEVGLWAISKKRV
ncbi:MAG TPA: hypothetical protein VNH18_11170 [Bryobacteraceae bacterium]|nr:hypothetical protein [Bryobacteraceae bacterium]